MKFVKLYKLDSNRLAAWLAVVFAPVIVIGNTGFWPMPNLSAQFLVSQNLTHNPFPDPLAQYLFTNYLQPAIFGFFGGESVITYGLYAAFVSLLFLIIFGVWFVGYHGKPVAVDQFKLFPAIVFPVFMVPFYWIGMDGMTCLLLLLTVMSFTSRWSVSWADIKNGFVFLGVVFSGQQSKIRAGLIGDFACACRLCTACFAQSSCKGGLAEKIDWWPVS